MQTQRMIGDGPRSNAPRFSQSRRASRSGNGNQRDGRAEALAKGLGWFSVGLGLAQILAPRGVARLIGASEHESTQKTMRGLGFRELTAGIGILTQPQPSGWLWSRVAGDLMDIALLSKALRSSDSDRGRVTAATAAVVGVTVLDAMSAMQLSRADGDGSTDRGYYRGGRGLPTGVGEASADGAEQGIEVVKSVTINRPPEEVYRFWRDLTNLPRFMAHLESVQLINGRSRWRAKAPAGLKVEWEAEVLEDRPNELISWRSVAGTHVPNQGSVRFSAAPGGRGTELKVELRYDPPGGVVGAAIAKLFGEEPAQQVASDLRRLKQVLETGEVVHSDASVHRGMHAARPSVKSPELAKQVMS